MIGGEYIVPSVSLIMLVKMILMTRHHKEK